MTYSTQGLQPHERFDYWRDALCANFYGMRFDVDRAKRNDFHGHITAKPLADAGVVEFQASSSLIHRLENEIQNAPGDALFLYRQRTGGAWIEAVDRDWGRRPSIQYRAAGNRRFQCHDPENPPSPFRIDRRKAYANLRARH
jgi:hypothetical protein